MNREQKAITIVTVVLVLVILGLMGGTYLMWQKSQIPVVPSTLTPRIQSPTPVHAPPGSTQVRLYYFDPEHDSLVVQPMILSIEPRLDQLLRQLQESLALMEQPAAFPGLVSPIPVGTEIETVFVDLERKTIYISLNAAYFNHHPGGTIEGWASLYSLVNMACSLSPFIEQVTLLKQGQPVVEGPGGWDYGRPFREDLSIVRDPSRSRTLP